MQGYIQLPRVFFESDLFRKKKYISLCKVFMWCFAMAMHTKHKTPEGFTLERGQLITGRFKSGEFLEIPPSTFQHKLKQLKKLGLVSTEEVEPLKKGKFNGATLVTVLNYDSYNIDSCANVISETEWLDTEELAPKDNGVLPLLRNGSEIVDNAKPTTVKTTESKPNPKVKLSLDYFCLMYKETFGRKYIMNYGKNYKLMKILYESGLTYDTIKYAIKIYFDTNDWFLEKNAYPFSLFYHNINKYIKNCCEPRPIAPIINGEPKGKSLLEQRFPDVQFDK